MVMSTAIPDLIARYFGNHIHWYIALGRRLPKVNGKYRSCYVLTSNNGCRSFFRSAARKYLFLSMYNRVVVLFLAMMGVATIAYAQTYPSRPIRVVSAEPGGSGDYLTRLMTTALSPALGQQVVVENRGGASGVLAIEAVVNAPPDGYTLLSYGSIWILPLLRPKLPYDILRDLSPISLLAVSPQVLVIHPSTPAGSVKDLIALARAKPGTINYGTGARGSSSHLAAELFRSLSGINITNVPYKGAGPALTALVAGQVEMSFASASSAALHIKAGRLKALGVTSARRTALFPDLPAISESVPGYESVYMLGMFAPAKTPQAVIARLNRELVRTVSTSDIKERFFSAGVEAVGGTPEEFRSTIESEMLRLGNVIKDANIQLEE